MASPSLATEAGQEIQLWRHNGRLFSSKLVTDAGILSFGDPVGSYVALALFGVLFSILGVGIGRQIRRRLPGRPQQAAAAGIVVFVGPLLLLYASSLGGFYEAETRGDCLVLRYLHPGRTELPLADISTVRAAPAFRGRWRLHLAMNDGREYASATWHREEIALAAERLRRAVPHAR